MKIEKARVKGGITLKYTPGDTEPPPQLRKCVTCGERYEPRVGRLCGCWDKEYEAFKASQPKSKP